MPVSVEGKVTFETEQLELDKRKSTNISELFFITFVSMSISWLAFDVSKFAICFSFSSLFACKVAKGDSFPLLHTSPMDDFCISQWT